MKAVELPDKIAEVLLKVPMEKRGDFLRIHGFIPPLESKKIQQSLLSESTSSVRLYTDGASRGNPGKAGIGFVIQDSDGTVLFEGTKYLGIVSNNVSEWTALLLGLQKVHELGIAHVDCFLDSELVVKQIRGEYKVKHPDLQPLYQVVKKLLQNFPHVSFMHIPREKNAHADRLSNRAIDEEVES